MTQMTEEPALQIECVLCKDKASKNIVVLEREDIKHFFFYWDSFPATPGHLLVIPKRHTANYKDLTLAELKELALAVLKAYEIIEQTDLTSLYKTLLPVSINDKSRIFITDALKQLQSKSTKPHGYNHGVNDGEAAGRTIGHLHYHILPRWVGDVENPRGGIRHMFEGKGNYLTG